MLATLALGGGCERPTSSEAPSEPPALSETTAIAVAALCREPTRAWAVLDEGGSIVAFTRGGCLGRVEHPDDGALWHLVAQLQGREDLRPSWELHTWLDERGHPRHAELRTPELVTRFSWRERELIVRRLGDELTLADADALWVTPSHALYLREVMLRLGVLRQQGWVPELDAVATLELTLERLDEDRAQARAGTRVLALEGATQGLAGLQIGAVMAGDALVYRPLGEQALADFLPAIPIPRYRPPEDLELRPIEIPGTPAGAPKLAGELVLAPSEAEEGRRPAVLFLAGAGVLLTLEDEIDISRGDMLVRVGNLPQVGTNLECTLCWLSEEPLNRHTPFILQHTTRQVRAHVDELTYRIDVDTLHREPAETLALNEIGRVRLNT
ncbi:MAG: hypothetical protein R6X02_15210, partial [Enhygromyxa sp.]